MIIQDIPQCKPETGQLQNCETNIFQGGELDAGLWHSLRDKVVTATECSTLFGVNPWMDLYTYWHIKHKGWENSFEETNFTFWGRQLEDAIAQGVYLAEGWQEHDYSLERCRAFHRHPDPAIRLGVTPDFFLHRNPFADRLALEIKNVSVQAWRENWNHVDEEGNSFTGPPIYYEMQLQAQLITCGLQWGAIVALVGGNEHHIFVRERNAVFESSLMRAITEFWQLQHAPEVETSMIPMDSIKRAFPRYEKPVTLDPDSETGRQFILQAQICINRKKQAELSEGEADDAKKEIIKMSGGISRIKCAGYSFTRAKNDAILVRYKAPAERLNLEW